MKLFLLTLIITLTCSQVAFADAKSQLEKVNSKEAAKLFIEKHNRVQKQLKEEARLNKLKKAEEAKLKKQQGKSAENQTKAEKIKQEKEIEAKIKADLENEKEVKEVKEEKNLTPEKMTNYQYDEYNYHYNKLENNYLKDNLDYANSGKNKY